MAVSFFPSSGARVVYLVAFLCVIAVAGTGIVLASPWLRSIVVASVGSAPASDDGNRGDHLNAVTEDNHSHDEHSDHDHAHHDHDGHDHDGHGSEEAAQDQIRLSEAARSNLGLETQPIEVGPFTEYIEVPGEVSNWPGRTHVAVASPLTGVVNAIHVTQGELIESGQRLFSLRLTHQDLVNAQQEFLAKLGQLDVERREIERLTAIASSGAVAGKTLINRQYERDRLLAGIQAARQSMLLHGLTEQQIEGIETSRELVQEVTIYAPILHEDRSLHHDSTHRPIAADTSESVPSTQLASLNKPPNHARHLESEFLVTEVNVSRGESVDAGEALAQLSDYRHVLVRGNAYQQDGRALRRAAQSGEPIQVVIESSNEAPEIVDDLNIVYIGHEIESESLVLPFYVELDNEIERSTTQAGRNYVSWRFKPGQRVRVRVPTASRGDAIVLPQRSLVRDGGESYVFVENGQVYERVPVQVVGRDSLSVAIANNGSIWPGQSVVVDGANQLLMAMKTRSGGAVDPHAGHSH